MSIKDCVNGKHKYITIYRTDGYDVEDRVEWCEYCGWCIVGTWVDNRLMLKPFSQRPQIFDLIREKNEEK